MPKIKKAIAEILLNITVNIVTRLPITNFTSRLVDKLIVKAGK